MNERFEVGPITPEDAHDLRRLVLRDGDPKASVEWNADDDASTVHLGAVDSSGLVIGISTWIVSPDPDLTSRIATQLRGMATAPTHVGIGVGRALLDAGVEHHRREGFDLVWANARVTALGFYEHAGFTVVSDAFTTPATGLPHRRIRLPLH